MNSAPFFVKTEDGVELAVWQSGDMTGPSVVLTHGTFSDHRICAALAHFLADAGFSCWTFDWRGHGASSRAPLDFTFDTVALRDVPAVVDAVVALTGRAQLFWVGHSGGALLASMWSARFPELAARRLNGIVMLGAQVTHAGRSLLERAAVHALHAATYVRERLPGKLLRVGPERESAALMRQWCRWNLDREFRGLDGFDYFAALARVNVPVLGLAGAGDSFIAPRGGCRALVDAYGSADATFRLCGATQGFAEDYTHDRLILSRNASCEIWPMIARWLRAHCVQPAPAA